MTAALPLPTPQDFPIGHLAEPQTQSYWRVIRCITGKEGAVSGQLFHFGIESEMLTHSVKRRPFGSSKFTMVERPLFPPYVLLKCQDEHRGEILRNLSYVIDFLRFGSQLAAVEQVEVSRARAMISSGLPLFPRIELIVGQKVRVKYGPLTGVIGEFKRWKGDDQLIANLPLLGRSLAVPMALDQVERISY